MNLANAMIMKDEITSKLGSCPISIADICAMQSIRSIGKRPKNEEKVLVARTGNKFVLVKTRGVRPVKVIDVKITEF